MAWWRKLWQSITKPSDKLVSSLEREQATLYVATIFVMILFVSLLTISSVFLRIIPSQIVPALFFSAVIYSGLYILSRSIYYRWSARLFIWIAISLIFYITLYLVPDDSMFALNFLVIPIMISGFAVPRREALANMILIVILIYLLIINNNNLSGNLFSINLLILSVGSISIIASMLIDGYRQQAIDNESRFRSLMNANYEGILIIDGKSARIIDANPAIERILGYSVTELVGRYPAEFISPEDKQATRNIWDKRAENVSIEVGIIHKQGYKLSVEACLRPYQFRSDKAYVLTIIDITERKQAEAFIIESEERFRAIFNESVDYIGVLDGGGKVLELNQRACDKFGLQSHEVFGKYLHDFDFWAHTEQAKIRTKAVIDEAIQGKASRYEVEARDKDNQRIYLDFSVKPITDTEGVTRMIISETRDITDFRQAEAKRREFEQRYETLFNSTTDAVFIFDMQGLILDANKQAESTLGAKHDEIIGRYVFDFVVEEEIHESSAILKGLREDKRVSVVNERRMRRASGEIFYAETLGLVVTDNQDKPRYVQSMVRDISERKRIEAERFVAALDSERTQLLAHFIENASHHFRTPITNMKTRMYLLPRVFDNPPKRDEQIVILNQELERLQNILNDLLMVLRLQKDDSEYTPARISINQLLSEVRQSFEGQDIYSNFDWTWQLNTQNSIVSGDKGLLSRSLINLVKNSIAYTPAGRKISIYSLTKDDYIVLDVVDEGRGIPENELPHIFDDFYRGQDSMQDNSTSSGLGLTITRMIVERHQGVIFVASPLTGGAHFQIILPRSHEGESNPIEMPSAMLDLTLSS